LGVKSSNKEKKWIKWFVKKLISSKLIYGRVLIMSRGYGEKSKNYK